MPDIIVRATQQDTYSRGASIKSVTQLINPPQIDILRRKNYHRMEEDVSDKLWMLMGKSIHSLLEAAATDDYLVEERLFANILNWNVSGAIDVQQLEEGYALIDYKFTSAYSVMSDPEGKPDWVCQQNFYGWLMYVTKNIRVEKIQICAIVRDWRRSAAEKDKKYPKSPIFMIDLPLWSLEQQEAYVNGRIKLHQDSELSHAMDELLPECSAEERWVQDGSWAVYKSKGALSGRALRVFKTEGEAAKYAGDNMVIQHRPGVASRCEGDYCGVARWCDQFQKDK